MKKLWKNKEQIITWIVFAVIFIFSLKGVYGGDIWFHLATGRFVFLNRTIPIKEVFSFAAEGATWVNQGWLADLVFYFLELLFGFVGLTLFFSLLSFFVFFLLFKILENLKVALVLNLFLTLMAAAIAVTRFQARPEVGSYVFILLVIFLLLRLRQQKKIIILMPLVFLLWTNWQAGFVPFGLYLIVGFLIRDFLATRKFTFHPLIVAFILSAAVTVINPNGIHGVAYFVSVQPKVLYSDFTEWGTLLTWLKSKSVLTNVEETLLNFGYLFSLLVLGLVSFFRFYRTKWQISDFGQEKGFWLWFSLPFLASPFLGNRFSSLAVIFIAIDLAVYSLSWPWLTKIITRQAVVVGLLVFGLTVTITRFIVFPPVVIARQKANPYRDEVMAFLVQEKIKGKMFNCLEDGGYFLWKNPQVKIFMDGRLDVYTNTDVYADYSKVYSFPPKSGWQEVLKKYDIEYLLLPGFQKEVMETVRQGGEYDLVYWSDYLFVLVKNNGLNREYVAKNALKKAEPYRDSDYPADDLPLAIADYEELKKRSPLSGNISIVLAGLYQQAKKDDEAILEYERGVSLRPDEGMAQLALGALYHGKKNCAEAVDHFEEARVSSSQSIKALANRNLGFTYNDCLGDPLSAYYYFRQYLRLVKKSKLSGDKAMVSEAESLVSELELSLKQPRR